MRVVMGCSSFREAVGGKPLLVSGRCVADGAAVFVERFHALDRSGKSVADTLTELEVAGLKRRLVELAIDADRRAA